MAYKVIILYQLYMPSYFLGTFTEYPRLAVVFHFVIHCFSSFQRLLYQYSSSLKKKSSLLG